MTTTARETRDEEIRAGILSIPSSAIRRLYALFSIGTVCLTIANTLKDAAAVNANGWPEIQSIATARQWRPRRKPPDNFDRKRRNKNG